VAWVLNHRPSRGRAAQLRGRLADQRGVRRPERKTLYCTESISGSVLRVELDAPGLSLHRRA
jgi:gluconolactonase